VIPSCVWRYGLHKGLTGHDVWAAQINFNAWRATQPLAPLAEDGIFGGNTERGVRTYQRRSGLHVDGVAGPNTQKQLALDLLRPKQEAFGLPQGLLRGGCELESGYFVGATNCNVPGGIDCGWMQIRVKDGASSAQYGAAFSGPEAFGSVAQRLRERKDRYTTLTGSNTKAWKYAVLAHNWPAAAEHYAEGDIQHWIYKSEGETYDMGDPAPWVERASGGRLHTGYEWADYYVNLWLPYCHDLDVT
jgi:hypothetical protein